ncbi:MAG: C-type lectin domain-containing protein [Myxococcota bacterium]|nr:C-type lectin domain-containing protein [Myxococcota bacterium]
MGSRLHGCLARSVCLSIVALLSACGRLGYDARGAQMDAAIDDLDVGPSEDGALAIDDAAVADGGPGDSGACGATGVERCNGLDDDCDEVVDPPGTCAPSCVGVTLRGTDYAVCSTVETWSEARARCTTMGMDLVRIDDAEEHAFVILVRASSSCWIGATDAALQDDWRWTIGDTLFYRDAPGGGAAVGGMFERFGSAEPNGGKREDCGMVEMSEFWIDAPCTRTVTSVCEGP